LKKRPRIDVLLAFSSGEPSNNCADIRNAEHAQRVFNTIRAAPLPAKQASTVPAKPTGQGGNWAGKKQVRINA
jgi:hypothetical protein